MSLNDARVPGEHGNPVFEALTNGRGRAVLRALRRRSAPVTAEDLAATLAANDDPDRERKVLIDLTHTVLPKLADAGLVERTESGVTAAGHPALDDPAVVRLLEADDGRAFEALSERRRRIAVSVLRKRSSPVDRQSLATAVAARERGVSASEVSEDAASDVLVSLYHVHLPVLEDAGLVRAGDEAQRIEYDGHPALDGDDAAETAVATAVTGD